ncbi:MAG: hypothetical protein EON59_00570 [Alphaproteobacteria bacterium]|nr:MAG: hypothetical protein EON59_00570 [Alphaproteobacteria bacterium]
MMQDGQTATNPQTGEKVVLRGGQWVPAGQGGPAAPAPIIYGRPKQVDPIDLQRDQIGLQRDQIGLEAARVSLDEKRSPAPKAPKMLPDGAAKRLEDTVGLYANLKGAAGGFKDEYSGNTVTGGLENTIQGLYSGFGSPGQRDWWASFRTLDNQIRNDLFGATLTPSEQKAYADTSINERMDPRTIRENLGRREGVIREALARRTKYLKANGFNPEAIDALTGEFASDFGEALPAPPPPAAGGDMAIRFAGDPEAPVTAKRYTPEQEAQIVQAVRDGDLGQVLSLSQRFSGNPPDEATIQGARAAIEAARKNPNTEVTIGYGALDEAAQSAADREKYGDNLQPAIDARRGSVVDPFVRGVADVATFGLADEIAAGATTLFSGGTMKENLQQERAIDQADSQVNGAPRLVGQFAGALANPIGRTAVGPGQMARAGATAGALYGFGTGDGLTSRATGALGGGTAGAVGGAVVGKLLPSNALARVASPRSVQQGERNALLQAAERQGVDLMPADVGGPITRRLTAAGAQAPLSAGPIINAGKRVADQSRAARDRIANDVGGVLDVEAAGEATRTGGERFVAATKAQADRYYDRAEKLAEGAKITPNRTMEALDRNIAELSEDPSALGGTHLAALEKLRSAIGSNQLSVAGIRSMRTRLRGQFLDDGLRSSDIQRRVGEVVDAASEDLTANLTEQGMEGAASAFRRADTFYRGRVEAIDNFLEPIIGKGRGGEQIVQALETASKSNGRRLQGIMAALPADERAAVQATIISRLGVKKADAEAADFSLDVFLSQWKAMTPRAKAALFPKEARASLDDLVKIADGSKAAGAYANRSNSAGGVMGNISLYVAGGVWEPVTASLGALGQYGAGKLLASPGFARWLARAPKSGNATATRTWVSRLPATATQSPALRGEIEKFQQRLLSNLSASPLRSAAEDRQADGGQKPVN